MTACYVLVCCYIFYSYNTSAVTSFSMATRPSRTLDTFANPTPERDYWVRMDIPEFTCLCPLTGQPDFARLLLDFVPDKRNLELKSLKLYIWSYRNEGAFHEAVTNAILDDLVKAIAPRFMRLTAKWYVRGWIFTTVTVEHRKKRWKSAQLVQVDGVSPLMPLDQSTGR